MITAPRPKVINDNSSVLWINYYIAYYTSKSGIWLVISRVAQKVPQEVANIYIGFCREFC